MPFAYAFPVIAFPVIAFPVIVVARGLCLESLATRLLEQQRQRQRAGTETLETTLPHPNNTTAPRFILHTLPRARPPT